MSQHVKLVDQLVDAFAAFTRRDGRSSSELYLRNRTKYGTSCGIERSAVVVAMAARPASTGPVLAASCSSGTAGWRLCVSLHLILGLPWPYWFQRWAPVSWLGLASHLGGSPEVGWPFRTTVHFTNEGFLVIASNPVRTHHMHLGS